MSAESFDNGEQQPKVEAEYNSKIAEENECAADGNVSKKETAKISSKAEGQHPKSDPNCGMTLFKMPDSNSSFGAATIKTQLLDWVKAQTREYENVHINNFSTSWNNGLAFCALIHHFYPDAFDYNNLTRDKKKYNFELAFKTAEEKAGIAPLLDVEDMVQMERPDWKSVFTYVQSMRHALCKISKLKPNSE